MAMDRAWGPEPLSAAVLAGGQSRRMGSDKALLRLAPNLPPLAALVIERLRAVTSDIVLVGPDRPGYREFGVPVVPDRFPGQGPLGGIATALTVATHPSCIVVGCDMPLLAPSLLRWMAMQPRDYDLLLPCLPGEGGAQCHPLHAIYAKSCLAAIERRLSQDQLEVQGLANEVRTRFVRAEEIAAIDPTFISFVNVNTSEDFAIVRSQFGLLRHEKSPGRRVARNPLY